MYVHLVACNVGAPRRTGSTAGNPCLDSWDSTYFNILGYQGLEIQVHLFMKFFHFPAKKTFRLLKSDWAWSQYPRRKRETFLWQKQVPQNTRVYSKFFLAFPPIPLTPLLSLPPPIHSCCLCSSVFSYHHLIVFSNNSMDPSQVSLRPFNPWSDCCLRHPSPCGPHPPRHSLKIEAVLPFQRSPRQEYQKNALCFPAKRKRVALYSVVGQHKLFGIRDILSSLCTGCAKPLTDIVPSQGYSHVDRSSQFTVRAPGNAPVQLIDTSQIKSCRLSSHLSLYVKFKPLEHRGPELTTRKGTFGQVRSCQFFFFKTCWASLSDSRFLQLWNVWWFQWSR